MRRYVLRIGNDKEIHEIIYRDFETRKQTAGRESKGFDKIGMVDHKKSEVKVNDR